MAAELAGWKIIPGTRALIAHEIRIGLRTEQRGLGMNEHELLNAALEIDAPDEATGR